MPASHLLCVTWSKNYHNSAVFIIDKTKYSIQSYPQSRTDAALVSQQTPRASSQKCLPHSKCFPTASLPAWPPAIAQLDVWQDLVQILWQEGWPDTPQLQSPVPQTPSPSEPKSVFYRVASPTQIGCLHTAFEGSPANGGSRHPDPPLQCSVPSHSEGSLAEL